MRLAYVLAAIGTFFSVIVLWELAVVGLLRSVRIRLPFALPFHFGRRRQQALLPLRTRIKKSTYVFISGFLLFACPLFTGAVAYDFVVNLHDSKETFGSGYIVGSLVLFFLFVVCGALLGAREWGSFEEEAERRT
jgi:hypothetical protein